MRRFFLAIIAFLAFAAARSEGGKIYYVSPKGKDTNPGTRLKPWRFPGSSSRRLKPGDTLVILGGKYLLDRYDEDILYPPSGTAARWITITGEEGNRPVLAARNNLLEAVDLSNRKYVRIRNLEITSDRGAQFRDGIEALGGPADHVILENLYVHHLDEFGVNVGDAEDLKLLNCRVEYCGFGAVGGPAGSRGGWRNVLIKGCRLSYSGHYYRGTSGPSPYDRPDGFGIEPSKGPIEIANTVAEHNRGDGLDSKAERTWIHECVVANNVADGVKLWGDGSRVENSLVYGRGDGEAQGGPWSAVVIAVEKPNARIDLVNVTVEDRAGGNYIMHVQYDYPKVPLHLTVRNSIFCARGERSSIYLARSVEAVLDHNLFFMPESDSVISRADEAYYGPGDLPSLGEANVYGDPAFRSPSSSSPADYHLGPESPALDAGTSRGAPATDLAGKPRPLGKGIDLGAYEEEGP